LIQLGLRLRLFSASSLSEASVRKVPIMLAINNIPALHGSHREFRSQPGEACRSAIYVCQPAEAHRTASPRRDTAVLMKARSSSRPHHNNSFPFDRILTVINDRMDRHEQRLERPQPTQLALCEQVKDIRVSLPMQRRPLSRWAQTRRHKAYIN
jgi:hypothetical protein